MFTVAAERHETKASDTRTLRRSSQYYTGLYKLVQLLDAFAHMFQCLANGSSGQTYVAILAMNAAELVGKSPLSKWY